MDWFTFIIITALLVIITMIVSSLTTSAAWSRYHDREIEFHEAMLFAALKRAYTRETLNDFEAYCLDEALRRWNLTR